MRQNSPTRTQRSNDAVLQSQTARPSWIRKHLVTLILVAVALLGFAIMFYPTFSNWYNQFHQSRAIMSYSEVVGDMDEELREQMLAAAQDYNARLAESGQKWTMTDEEEAEYNSLLNVDGTGVMGTISIPKINVSLPIYHGTDDAVLQTSIGHLTGTALPVGGESTHCVLSGHRGLPSARLFTDLDQLVEGDTFSITVLDQTLTYEVDQIRVVEPTDLSDLQVEEGKDLCTLVTCTPYGINTHRLLVRGHRVANPNGDAQVIAEAVQVRDGVVAFAMAVPIVVVLVIVVLIRSAYRARVRRAEDAYWATHALTRPEVDAAEELEALRQMRGRGRGRKKR